MVRQMVRLIASAVLLGAGLTGVVHAEEAGFEALFDGKSLAGWKANENPQSWQIAEGKIVCHGPRSHLFYVGADAAQPAEFKNFHFKSEVMTRPQANSGIFVHTKFQPDGWPAQALEIMVAGNEHMLEFLLIPLGIVIRPRRQQLRQMRVAYEHGMPLPPRIWCAV